MKRTISEVIDLIKEKIDNCERNEYALHSAREMGLLNKTEKEKIRELVGCKQAYTDVLYLLETSHLIEQDKVIEILKKKFKLFSYRYLIDTPEEEYAYIADINENGHISYISKEEYKVLSEVFKDD